MVNKIKQNANLPTGLVDDNIIHITTDLMRFRSKSETLVEELPPIASLP